MPIRKIKSRLQTEFILLELSNMMVKTEWNNFVELFQSKFL